MGKKSDLQKEIENRELSSQIQIQMELESRNLFKNETARRHAMTSGGRRVAILAIILVVLLVVSILLVPTGNTSLYSWRREVISIFSSFFQFGLSSRYRLACFVAIALAGMAMTTAGASYQGIFQNAMASPTTLGVQAGGTLGGLIYLLFFVNSKTLAFWADHITNLGGSNYIWVIRMSEYQEYIESLSQTQKFGLELWEIAGCFFGVALIVGLSMLAGRGKINTVALMLTGSIFSTVVGELATTARYVILYSKPTEMEDARYVLISRMSGSAISVMDGNQLPTDQFLWLAVPIAVCLLVIFTMTGKLNVLMFGEEEAKVMGVPVQAYRLLFIFFCTMLCAVVFNFCGAVSMLGFIIPHLARYMVGPNFKTLVPASALLGGITTLLIWDFCAVINQPGRFNLYTGVICSVLSLVFILFYRRQRHASWT